MGRWVGGFVGSWVRGFVGQKGGQDDRYDGMVRGWGRVMAGIILESPCSPGMQRNGKCLPLLSSPTKGGDAT